MQLFVLVAVLSAAALSSAQNCPSVTVQRDFDISRYTKLWYEIAKVPNRFEPEGACTTATYTLQSDPVYPVHVFNRLINAQLGYYYTGIVGGARLADASSTEAKLKVKFSVSPRESDNWVLETDYDNYSLVFSCNEYNGTYTRSSWILSRTQVMDDVSREKVNAAIQRNSLDASLYVPTRQGGACTYA